MYSIMTSQLSQITTSMEVGVRAPGQPLYATYTYQHFILWPQFPYRWYRPDRLKGFAQGPNSGWVADPGSEPPIWSVHSPKLYLLDCTVSNLLRAPGSLARDAYVPRHVCSLLPPRAFSLVCVNVCLTLQIGFECRGFILKRMNF